MLFLLATPEYTNVQSNTTKVKVHLRNGVAEVFDLHQDLMGRIDNNIVEIETNFENRLEKVLFVLQDAVFIVSNKGLDPNMDATGTSVYVYAKRAKEIGSGISLDELTKQYDQKNTELEKATAKLSEQNVDSLDKALNSKIFVLQDEVTFLKKVVSIVKDLRS
jgi:F0F1-type ATP synthase epsilon subunit